MTSSVLSKIGFDLPHQLSSNLYSVEYVLINPTNGPSNGTSYTGDSDVIFDITSASDCLLDPTNSSLLFDASVRTVFNNTTLLGDTDFPNIEHMPMFCSGVPITRSTTTVNGGSIRVGEISTNFNRYATMRLLCSDDALLPNETNLPEGTQRPSVTLANPPVGGTFTCDNHETARTLMYVNRGLTLNSYSGCNIVAWTTRAQSIQAQMNRTSTPRVKFQANSGGLAYEVPLPLLSQLCDTPSYIPVNFLAQTTGSSGIRLTFRFASAPKDTFGPCCYTQNVMAPTDTLYGRNVIDTVDCLYSNVRILLKFVRIKDPELMGSLVALYNQSPSILPDGQMIPPMGRLTLNFKNTLWYENPLNSGVTRADLTFNINQKSVLGMAMRFRDPAKIQNPANIEKNLTDSPPQITSFFIELGNDSTIPLTSITSEVNSWDPASSKNSWQCNSAFGAMYRAGRHIFAIDPIHSSGGSGALSRFYTLAPNVGGDEHEYIGVLAANHFDFLKNVDAPYMIVCSFENFSSKEVDLSAPENPVRGLNTWTKNGIITVRMQFAEALASPLVVETLFIYNDILLIARGSISSVCNELLR